MVTVSPVVPPVADIVGVLSDVLLSVDEVPVSDEDARSGALGAVGPVVSTTIDNAELADEALPAGSVTVDVTDHVPLVKPVIAHDVTLGDATYEQVLVVPPLTADITTVSPSVTFGAEKEGVVDDVRLSEFEVPVSADGNRSGAEAVGAVVSIVRGRDGLLGEVFPAGSVSVDVTSQVPSVSAGKVHDVAGNT